MRTATASLLGVPPPPFSFFDPVFLLASEVAIVHKTQDGLLEFDSTTLERNER